MTEKGKQTESRSLENCGFSDSGENFHAVSLSGGKDSTCALILMTGRGMPIDAVLYADTGMEFPEMYGHLAEAGAYLYRERGIHITTLRHPKGFAWMMFEEPKKRPSAVARRLEAGLPTCGNGWLGIRVRWCTGQLKVHLLEREINRMKGSRHVESFIGIAADEAGRCREGKRYPLVEWGITEKEALEICYKRGFCFGGLYEIYHRASCWCCPFQRIGELRRLRGHHPKLWAGLMEMDRRAREQFGDSPPGRFKERWSVAGLEERFAREEGGAKSPQEAMGP